VTEEFPFDNETLAFKVMGKIFALTHIDTFESITLKCDPNRALELREQFEEVIPGYHMNKKHWNTVMLNGRLGDQLLVELIDHSYGCVVATLPLKSRKRLAQSS
jgi:predicted DNA-binding protein (MmcQ/YjbR family)